MRVILRRKYQIVFCDEFGVKFSIEKRPKGKLFIKSNNYENILTFANLKSIINWLNKFSTR